MMFFNCLSVLLLTQATGKKATAQSDLALLFEIQHRWQGFWKKASADIVVNNCEHNCRWKEIEEEE